MELAVSLLVCAGSAAIDFSTLQEYSATSNPPELVAPKAMNPQAASARVAEAMSRPGPSVRAEDLTEVPFAGNIELLAPKKYRYVVHDGLRGSAVILVVIFKTVQEMTDKE